MVSGYCGSGIGASGGVGTTIVELASEGKTRFDIESFRTDRFGRINAFSRELRQRCANTCTYKS